jgi:hypothetical protein
MEIQFSGQMTRDDFIRANKAAERTNPKATTLPLWVILAGSGSLLILGSIWQMIATPAAPFWIILAGVIGIIFLTLGMNTRKYLDRFWENNQYLHANYEGIITEEYIDFQIPTIHYHFLWSDLKSYKDSGNVVLLLQHSGTGHIFSARFFKNDNDWLEFKKMLVEKVPRPLDIYTPKTSNRQSFLVTLLLLFGLAMMVLLFLVETNK